MVSAPGTGRAWDRGRGGAEGEVGPGSRSKSRSDQDRDRARCRRRAGESLVAPDLGSGPPLPVAVRTAGCAKWTLLPSLGHVITVTRGINNFLVNQLCTQLLECEIS